MNIDLTLLSLVGEIGFIIIALVGLIGVILYRFEKFKIDVNNKLKADLLKREIGMDSDIHVSAEKKVQSSKKSKKN